MPELTKCLIASDFNLIRRPEDSNNEGGDATEMYLFNEAIYTLGFIELSIHGRHFTSTWTNKQLPHHTRATELVFHLKCLDREIPQHNSEDHG